MATQNRTIAIIPPIRVEQFERERRQKQYESFATPGTLIDIRVLKGGPPLTDREYELLWTSMFMVIEAEIAAEEGASAIVLDCTADPALEEISEAVDVPVVGALAAGVFAALQLSRRFSVLALDSDWARMISSRLHDYGLEKRLSTVEVVGTHVYQPSRGRNMDKAEGDDFYKRLLSAGTHAVDAGADSIVLGSTTIIDGREQLEADLGVPVVAPGPAALRTAEFLADLGFRPSRRSYPRPNYTFGREMRAMLEKVGRTTA